MISTGLGLIFVAAGILAVAQGAHNAELAVLMWILGAVLIAL